MSRSTAPPSSASPVARPRARRTEPSPGRAAEPSRRAWRLPGSTSPSTGELVARVTGTATSSASGWTSTRRRSPRPTRRPGGPSAGDRLEGFKTVESGRPTPPRSRSTRRGADLEAGPRRERPRADRLTPAVSAPRRSASAVARIPHVDGGLRENTPEKATALCREHGVRFNIENHPEKSAAEILAKIGGATSGSASASTRAGWGPKGVSGPA